MANPRRCIGNIVKITFVIKGKRIPAPIACTTLPTKITEKVGATAHITVPTEKIPIENKNNCLVVNLCIKKAVIGMTIPFVNKKMVLNQLAVSAETLKEFIIGGSATLITV
jgi:hypothetical protein